MTEARQGEDRYGRPVESLRHATLAARLVGAAMAKNWAVCGWTIAKAEHDGGTLPNGYVTVKRPDAPLDDRAYATLMWVDRSGDGDGTQGVTFAAGTYDLTLRRAFTDLAERSGVETAEIDEREEARI